QNEWTLDLMRQIPEAPDGTMHLLIQRAIQSAAALKCPRFSLAAVPYDGPDATRLLARLRRRAAATSDSDGLRRFKNSFAPGWQVLYAAAPGRVSLIAGLWDIWQRVNRRTGHRRRSATR
ncbi:MAG: phosphatidylglycerol lysyltransferase domain-containing protein, partial [Paracoccaceae bacterium]